MFGHASQDEVRKQFLQQFYWAVKYDHSTHRTAFDANHVSGNMTLKLKSYRFDMLSSNELLLINTCHEEVMMVGNCAYMYIL